MSIGLVRLSVCLFVLTPLSIFATATVLELLPPSNVDTWWKSGSYMPSRVPFIIEACGEVLGCASMIVFDMVGFGKHASTSFVGLYIGEEFPG